MDNNVSHDPHRTHLVFVTISFERNLALLVSFSDTIAVLKTKLIDEYALFFPNLEPLMISGLKVKRSGKFYRLSESMHVGDAFYGVKGDWFLHVDVSTSKHNGVEVCSPKSFAEPYDGDRPCNFEMFVDKNKKIERKADCASGIVVRRDPKQDLPLKSVKDSDESETKAIASKPIENASVNAGQEFPKPGIDKSLNVHSMVSGENVQEKEVCGNSVKSTKRNFNSNQDVSLEAYTDDKRTDFMKKKNKKHKSKEAHLFITDKGPEFEITLGGNVLESVVAEVGCNSFEKPVRGAPNSCKVDEPLLISEIKGNVDAEKVNDSKLSSITDGCCDPNRVLPLEVPKSDEHRAVKSKRKRSVAKDASNGIKYNMNEAVQDNSSELQQVIKRESVQEKIVLSQESISKESLLVKCSKDITDKNDTSVHHPYKPDVNWNIENDKGNNVTRDSQSSKSGVIHEKLDPCLSDKTSNRKKKDKPGQSNMNVYKKDLLLKTKFSADNAEADESTYGTDRNTVISVEENAKREDDNVVPVPGRFDSNISEKTSHKTKERKNKLEESEATLHKKNENLIAKEHEVVRNLLVENTINLNFAPISECTDYQPSQDRMNVQCKNLNLVSNKTPGENDRNVESNSLLSPQKEGNKTKKKKKLTNGSLSDTVSENSLDLNRDYLVKEPSSKEVLFNGLAASQVPKKHLCYEAAPGEVNKFISNGKGDSVAAEKEMDTNGTIMTKRGKAKDNARKMQKANVAEMPLRRSKRSKGSQQSGSMIEHVESANCETSVDQSVCVPSKGHIYEADISENGNAVPENGDNIQKHIATDTSAPRKANPMDDEQHEIMKPSKYEDKEPKKRNGEPIEDTLLHEIVVNSKVTEENLAESSYDSYTSNNSTSRDWSDRESEELVRGSPDGGKKKSAKAMMYGMSFRDVLRGSSSYKKAKKSTSHTGLQSPSFDLVPDTCP